MNFIINPNFFNNWQHNWKDRSLCSMVQNDDSGSVRSDLHRYWIEVISNFDLVKDFAEVVNYITKFLKTRPVLFR